MRLVSKVLLSFPNGCQHGSVEGEVLPGPGPVVKLSTLTTVTHHPAQSTTLNALNNRAALHSVPGVSGELKLSGREIATARSTVVDISKQCRWILGYFDVFSCFRVEEGDLAVLEEQPSYPLTETCTRRAL